MDESNCAFADSQEWLSTMNKLVNRRFELRALSLTVVVLVFLMAGFSAFAQTETIQPGDLSPNEVNRIVQTFTAKEGKFRRALNNYAFKRDALVQTLGMGGQVIGEYHRISYFTFDDQGARYEKISSFPIPTFTGVTPEDLEDLGGINPFALEPDKINQYNFKYVGKEKIDELNLYVFDVTPKVIPDPRKIKERLFLGRVWVEDQDLQIVKTRGKGVPETKINKFPNVETYREEIDGRYWFPTYSYANEDLIFDSGEVLHIRMMVRYTDFAPARASVKIYEGEYRPPADQPSQQNQPNTESTPTTPQLTPVTQPGVVQGGILNKKALELPDPEYPPEMRRAGAGGKVIVSVIVDETGKVISAEVEQGPIQFRRFALAAARKARFAPTIVDGKPVKVSGAIDYVFAP